jgi:hypothetical protein
VNHAPHRRGLGGAKEVSRSLHVHLAVPLEVVNWIELPSKMQGCVDLIRTEAVAQFFPWRSQIKLKK